MTMYTTEDTVIQVSKVLDEMFMTYDARVLAAIFGLRTARTYAILKDIGQETTESTSRMFQMLEAIAQEKPETETRVVYSDTPAGVQ